MHISFLVCSQHFQIPGNFIKICNNIVDIYSFGHKRNEAVEILLKRYQLNFMKKPIVPINTSKWMKVGD